MTITLAGVLLAAIAVIVGSTMARTFSRYGARVSGLGQDLAECREFIELRMVQRPTTPLRALVSPGLAVRRVSPAEPIALRAAA
jgi:hypothetical protein